MINISEFEHYISHVSSSDFEIIENQNIFCLKIPKCNLKIVSRTF
jgi:hypothetical protein